MAEPKPEDMLDIRNVALLAEIIPIVTAEVMQMTRALENRMANAITNKEMTPDMAVQAWYEKYAYRKLLTSLNQKVRLGQSKGAAVADGLDLKG